MSAEIDDAGAVGFGFGIFESLFEGFHIVAVAAYDLDVPVVGFESFSSVFGK